jgi:hypothetical protein
VFLLKYIKLVEHNATSRDLIDWNPDSWDLIVWNPDSRPLNFRKLRKKIPGIQIPGI